MQKWFNIWCNSTEEYLVDFNCQRSAIAAGYSPPGAKVTASKLLTQPNLRALLQKRQAALAARLEVTREDILHGLLETIEMAREQGGAQAMIKAAAEINKMLGFYPSPKARNTAGDPVSEGGLTRLSDAALIAMLERSTAG